ncbi:MAG: class I SAM-dependent methyltransferase [Thermoplasmata archaeon]
MVDYWSDFEEYELDVNEEAQGLVDEQEKRLKKAFSKIDDKYYPADLGRENAVLLYSFIRETKPDMMVETGVCNGLSSVIMLTAMERNGKGKLYSVDLPVKAGEIEGKNAAVIPPGMESGWMVPEGLRDRWELYLGNTFYKLPMLFDGISKIDIFLHDSEHTYEAMMFEYCLAWKHLKAEGFLLSDNVDHSEAFRDFAAAMDKKKYRMNELGLLNKHSRK